jgi:serine/threonine protein kinase
MVGQTISHYRIVEKLGEGGMGVVYRAEDLKLGRVVALKFLPSHLIESAEHKARFLQEARAAALLDHPNICTVFEIDEANGQTFLAMTCLEGQTLRQKIADRPLPLDEALSMAVQIGEGLQAAHEKGIVHRDIKPANIMITPQGLVKIMDFGLAQLSDRTKLTASGIKLGTPSYMSPEQTEGKPTDRRTDIWALGVVLYEVISGRVPFAGEVEAAVAYAIVHTEPEPLTAQRSGVPIELDRIVAKALAKQADQRYQHADELQVDLRALRQKLETGASLAGVRRRRPKKLAWASAAALLAAAAVVSLLWQPSGGQPAARSEWVQLTNFPDSAVQPALSPDGRMLTFIRGPSTFVTRGEVYVKILPDGNPVQLTRDDQPKMSPVFSPDGSRIAYTAGGWDTWIAPALGGEPQLWLPNASGLVWVDKRTLLFSEIKKGQHMAIVTAEESRAGARNVYVPPRETGMAHRSYPSPDGKWVLVVEMDPSPWLPCRLVPSDGSSPGRQVGPPEAGCTYAAWSPQSHRAAGYLLWRTFARRPLDADHCLWGECTREHLAYGALARRRRTPNSHFQQRAPAVVARPNEAVPLGRTTHGAGSLRRARADLRNPSATRKPAAGHLRPRLPMGR